VSITNPPQTGGFFVLEEVNFMSESENNIYRENADNNVYASRDFVVTGDEDPRVVATMAAMEVRRSSMGHLEAVANGTRVEMPKSQVVYRA
jgi:hypothetical protein